MTEDNDRDRGLATSRRGFLTAAGIAVAGSAVGAGAADQTLAATSDPGQPRQRSRFGASIRAAS